MSTHPHDDPRQTAAEALARRDAGWTSADAARFDEWRQANPENAAAAAEVEAMHMRLAGLRQVPAAAALLAEADALLRSRRVVRFPRWALWTTIAAAAAVVLVVLQVVERIALPPAPFVVAAEQHRTVDLPDGSTLQLGAATTAEVAFSPGERRVTLQQGEGHFSVAKDEQRPFIVAVGEVRVRAVGTAFDVHRTADAVEVRVTEGKVRVSANRVALAQPLYLTAGEGISIGAAAHVAGTPDASAPQIATRFAHTAPRFTFANTPLSEVIARFNGYSRLQIELAEPDLGRRCVGGTFDADRAEAFVELLTAAGDVRAERLSETHVVLHSNR